MADTENPEPAAGATRVGAAQARGQGPPPCATCDCCQRQGPGPGRSLQVARQTSVLPSPENTTQYTDRQSQVSQELCLAHWGLLQNRKAGICSPAPVSYANTHRPVMTMGNFCQHWRIKRLRFPVLPAFASGHTKEKSSGNKPWHSQERKRRKMQTVLNSLVFTV